MMRKMRGEMLWACWVMGFKVRNILKFYNIENSTKNNPNKSNLLFLVYSLVMCDWILVSFRRYNYISSQVFVSLIHIDIGIKFLTQKYCNGNLRGTPYCHVIKAWTIRHHNNSSSLRIYVHPIIGIITISTSLYLELNTPELLLYL